MFKGGATKADVEKMRENAKVQTKGRRVSKHLQFHPQWIPPHALLNMEMGREIIKTEQTFIHQLGWAKRPLFTKVLVISMIRPFVKFLATLHNIQPLLDMVTNVK